MWIRWMTAWLMLMFSTGAWAITPYLQGDPVAGGTVQTVASAVETKLKNHGFKVVGKYFPKNLAGHGVIVVTDDAMLDMLGTVGGHAIMGAAIRVGIKADGSVSYTQPEYWYRAYLRQDYDRRETLVKTLQSRLKQALGAGAGFGGDVPSASLANYRYMVGMERIDTSKSRLQDYPTFNDAIKAVRENLAKTPAKLSRVYEIVLPERKLAVFGVAFHEIAQGDGAWMKRIDMTESIAGLPYEIYIVDNQVHAPHGRFRIALAFPSVGMGQFMRISSVPNEIADALGTVAGVVKIEAEPWQ